MPTNAVPSDAAAIMQGLDGDVWTDADVAGPSLASRLVAECIGTAVLVSVPLATALLAMPMNADSTLIPAFAFGFTVLALIVALGHISGAHVNSAITIGFWLSGRFPAKDVAPYIIAQVTGAILGGAALLGLGAATPGVESAREFVGRVSMGFGEHSPGGYGLVAALVAEAVFTGLLMAIVLSATSVKAAHGLAPLTISLGLFVLVLVGIPFTGAGFNPARVTGTAVFADAWALQQLWVFWVAPVLGAALVGFLYRVFGPEEDLETVEVLEVIAD